MNETPVLIVGGGPVGLALALGLARQNVHSTLFETKSEIDPHSRALGILPRTLEIFRDWNIYDRFVSEGGISQQSTRTLLAGMIVVLLITLGSAQAENMRHDRLVTLLSDPGSDLSGLKGDYKLQAAAALDARLHFQKYKNRDYRKDCLGIGLEHAVKHHLKGRAVDVYALAFDAGCSAFLAK